MTFKLQSIFALLISLTLLFADKTTIQAFEIDSDPTYIIINFSDSFHFLDWGASEQDWVETVKPAAKKRLENLRNVLFYPRGTGNYILGWSTLLEYTNYPQGTPSTSSLYVVRLRRMLELAQEENFPIFIPLNGFQWWDELPELWNYWDYDGNQTPRCTNNNYLHCPFAKLRDPDYRARFIAGYNQDNQWNVDWRDWSTPMKFVTRNWGGGDIWVAPPPNIVSSPQVADSFANLQVDRYRELVKVISEVVTRWDQEGKQQLFAGLAIGTEVSLYQSLDPKAAFMRSYGFRAIQDRFCPASDPLCGTTREWSVSELNTMRSQIMTEYFTKLGQIAHADGIPKERIYAHSWNEKDGSDHDQSFSNNFASGLTLYTRPAQSLYQLATNPLSFDLLSRTLSSGGYPGWAAPEYAPLDRSNASWSKAFSSTFGSLAPPQLIDIYNETDILSTAAIPELKSLLNQPKITKTACQISLTSSTSLNLIDPLELSWRTLDPLDGAISSELYLWSTGEVPTQIEDTTRHYNLAPNILVQQVPKKLAPGQYYWTIKRIGCDNTRWTISNLQTFTIRSWKERTLKENILYWYHNLRNKTVY